MKKFIHFIQMSEQPLVHQAQKRYLSSIKESNGVHLVRLALDTA